jgi:predicted GIY-YIG superfamily endonuclease
VYLIHTETKLAHAGHYLGFSDNLAARIACHEHGNGAKLMAAFARNDIRWAVVRVWPDGDRELERKLKNQHHGPRLCPICCGRVHKGFAIDIKQLAFEKGLPALASHTGKRKPMNTIAPDYLK